LQQGLNQTCSPRWDLSNGVSHSQLGGRKKVDSRLLVVRSQIASLTPGLSFAHNLGDRCPNEQCEAIFGIYASRPFQWHQKHFNARCFGPYCRALNIRESRRAPNPHFFQVLGFTPTLGQSRVATDLMVVSTSSVPFRNAKEIHAFILQAFVEVYSPLDFFVVHLGLAISEPHHYSICFYCSTFQYL